jgi:hypothetical protein
MLYFRCAGVSVEEEGCAGGRDAGGERAGVSVTNVSIRQHTPAYVSIRQHTSAYVSRRQHTSAYVRRRASRCVVFVL